MKTTTNITARKKIRKSIASDRDLGRTRKTAEDNALALCDLLGVEFDAHFKIVDDALYDIYGPEFIED